jgi:hypothetical protein
VLRDRLSRVGLLLAAAGFAVLGMSFYNWTQADTLNRLFYIDAERQWVRAAASSAPALESDETWQVTAACVRPYFVAAAEETRAKLAGYDDTVPDEVRAWRNRPQRQQQDDSRQDGERRESQAARAEADADADFKLHEKYQDWFLIEFRLENLLKQWERRLSTLVDRSTTLGEARRRIMDPRLYLSNDPELASAGRDLDHFVYFLLGFGGFADEQVNAIRATCVEIIPMKLVVTASSYRTDVWRWPLERAAAFGAGLALVLIGLVLVRPRRRGP